MREQFLCQHIADPPPGVNTNLPPVNEAKPQTNRERMTEHTTNKSCAGCHNLIDPIGNVPLFAGFMYSAVGSYLVRVRRVFDLRYTRYPPKAATVVVAALIYVNFFSHHYVTDIRWPLVAAVAALYGRSWVYFRLGRQDRRMPTLVSTALVALFIWLAENVATYAKVWVYPDQSAGWRPVGLWQAGWSATSLTG